ncbi:MAG: ABC transporter ATP-binding protein [Coriobacteriales bacterium]|jgi:sodium transport system ATP-binding protein|nr:ABC transporter ATP-binding protein [Coriobacteriales bacterium]
MLEGIYERSNQRNGPERIREQWPSTTYKPAVQEAARGATSMTDAAHTHASHQSGADSCSDNTPIHVSRFPQEALRDMVPSDLPRDPSHEAPYDTQDTLVVADKLLKTFKLSPRQQRLERSHSRLRVAVDELSFTAYAGEIFGLLGPNGAGKTTTLRILATLIKSQDGDAFVAGHSVRTDPEAVRSNIGFLTSELKLEAFFTPSYLFDFFANLYGVNPQAAAARKAELFARFGINDFAEVKVADLSTGMKQKASLVVSLAHDPSLIIFDEPTNGLDVLTAKTVVDYLDEARNAGKTIILSTHIFSLAETICDRVGIIIDGRMVASGPTNELRGGRSLEEVFFDLYVSIKGDER